MVFWKDDSICIHDDIVYEHGLDTLLLQVIPEFDPFGETRVTAGDWKTIRALAAEIGGTVYELVCDADNWIRETFSEYTTFTILGL